MAIIRNSEQFVDSVNYVSALAFFCAITCLSMMLKFGGFKASLNLFNTRKKDKDIKESKELQHGLCLTGAYRVNKDDTFENTSTYNAPKKITPSMVKLPKDKTGLLTGRPKSAAMDVTVPNKTQDKVRQSTPNVSTDPNGDHEAQLPRNSRHKSQNKEQKTNETQKLEQIDKVTAREQAKQDKLKKEKERKEAKENAKKDKKKRKAPVPQTQQEDTHRPTQSSTNTLESSISRSSGPPPYSETPPTIEIGGQNDRPGDVTFGKPIDTGSWDMISQHRERMSKTKNKTDKHTKHTVMDLNFSVKNDQANSEA